jgi:hypothetical protein
MADIPKLPDGVKLVKSDTFWPEGSWYFIQDLAVPLVWSHKDGWKKYYEANRADCHFHSAEDAMKAWEKDATANEHPPV